jgi:hypothetical protein
VNAAEQKDILLDCGTPSCELEYQDSDWVEHIHTSASGEGTSTLTGSRAAAFADGIGVSVP